MRALVQRVIRGGVIIGGKYHCKIGKGMVVFVGVKDGDTDSDAVYLAAKCAQLRIFEDERERMNYSVKDIGGEVLAVSQFTLYGDTRKGNRPSFTDAAKPEVAERVYNCFVQNMGRHVGVERVATGLFRTMMEVEIINDGPVTVLVLSPNDRWHESRGGNVICGRQ
jgi:D-tyrosyl-tRNA(Tyr) deacylase